MYKKLTRDVPWLVAVNSMAIFGLSALGIYARIQGKERGLVNLFSDPFSSHYFYLGWLTGISEIIWCIAIAICLFTFSLLPREHQYRWFLLASGMLMTLFYIDDRFRLTLILSAFFKSFIKVKAVIYLLYGGLMVAYGKRFWCLIRRTAYFPLLAAFFLFGFSSAVDITPIGNRAFHAMLEDGTKLIGLINLVIYFWDLCYRELRQLLKES